MGNQSPSFGTQGKVCDHYIAAFAQGQSCKTEIDSGTCSRDDSCLTLDIHCHCQDWKQGKAMTKLRAVAAGTYDGYLKIVYYLTTYISIYVSVIGRIT